MNPPHLNALVNEATKRPPHKKEIVLDHDDVFLADGSKFKPLPVKNTSDVLRASLLMLFKHVSDIHVTIVEIIAEKYGLSVEDIHKTITEDSRWSDIFVHPLISDLTETAEKQAEPKVTPPAKPKAPAKKKIVLSDEPEMVFD
jgi:hypothetical protein